MAEAEAEAQKSEDIAKVISYIEQKEASLSRYSDKLRQSIDKLVKIFGNKDICRVCGHDVVFHPVRKRGTGEVVCNNFKPKIEVSIDIIDDVPFYEEKDEFVGEINYYLAFHKHSLLMALRYQDGSIDYVLFRDASREKLKALVRSGRLIPFLQKVANMLKGKCEEYREVSEIAEKLANAIS